MYACYTQAIHYKVRIHTYTTNITALFVTLCGFFLYQSSIEKKCDLPYCHISCVNCCYEVVDDRRITESTIPFSSLCIIYPSKLDAWIETNRSSWNPYPGPDVDLFNGHTTYVKKYIDKLWFNDDQFREFKHRFIYNFMILRYKIIIT